MSVYEVERLVEAKRDSRAAALKYLTSTTSRWTKVTVVQDAIRTVFEETEFQGAFILCSALEEILQRNGVTGFGLEGLGKLPLLQLWMTEFSHNADLIPELQSYEIERRRLLKMRQRENLEIRLRHKRNISPVPFFVESLRKRSLDIPLVRDGRLVRVEPDSSFVALDKSGHTSIGYIFNHPGVQLAFLFGGNSPEPILRLVVAMFDNGKLLILFQKDNVFLKIPQTVFRLLLLLEKGMKIKKRVSSSKSRKAKLLTALVGFNRNFGHTIINDLGGVQLTEAMLAEGYIDRVLADEDELSASLACYRSVRHSEKTKCIRPRLPYFLHSKSETFVKLTHQLPLSETSDRFLRTGRVMLRLRGGKAAPAVRRLMQEPSRPRIIIGTGARSGNRNPRNERQLVLSICKRLSQLHPGGMTLLLDGMTSSFRQFRSGNMQADQHCDALFDEAVELYGDQLNFVKLAGLTLPEKIALAEGAELAVYPYGSGMVSGIFLLDLQILLHGPPAFTDNRAWDWHIEPFCRPDRRKGFAFFPNLQVGPSGYNIDVPAALRLLEESLNKDQPSTQKKAI